MLSRAAFLTWVPRTKRAEVFSESPMKDALLATVIDETAAVHAFESLLAYEEKALTAAAPLESLPSIIEQKTALTEQIAALERQRDEQLVALGYRRDLPAWSRRWRVMKRSRRTGRRYWPRRRVRAGGITVMAC